MRQRVLYRAGALFRLPFGLRSAGAAVLSPGEATDERRIDFFQILATVRGSGSIRAGSRDIPVGMAEAACCFPDSIHRLTAGKNGWEYQWITVDGPYAAAVFNALAIPRMPFAADDIPLQIKQLRVIMKDTRSSAAARASALVYRLLTRISSRVHTPADRPDPVIRYIDAHFADPGCTVASAAAALKLSRSTVNRRCRELCAMPAKDYIDSLRLSRALTLLAAQEHATTGEIARAAGFSDPNYFTKFFRRKMGVPPSRFRSLP